MRFLNRPIFVCAALFLFIETLSASVSLNSKCICLPPVNACSQSYRCNLNSTIYTSSQSVPSWVTPPIRDLVLATIDRVKNGTLTDFDATMACDGSDGTKVWANDCSVNGGGYLTGYGSLGFQPFGNHSGTWLTQILGQVEDPTGDPWLNSAICPGELYVTITYINDTHPYDSMGFNVLTSVQEAPADSPFNQRTDNDLIARGYDMVCFKPNPSSYNDNELVHFNCPSINYTWYQNNPYELNDTSTPSCPTRKTSGCPGINGYKDVQVF